jgi:hypothetical protein
LAATCGSSAWPPTRVGGVTYTYQNIGNFLNNIPQQIQYFGDLSEPSPFHNGATGLKHTAQDYYVGFAQDEWRVSSKATLNLGLRYDYYTSMKERDNRIVKFNIETGQLDPDTTPFYQSRKNSFQPRVSSTYALTDKTVLRGGFGIFVGPGQTEDQIQPIEAERISTTATSGAFLFFPVDENAIRANFINNPNNRSYQPRAYANDYTLPERVYQYTASDSAGTAGCDDGNDRVCRQPGSEPVPPQRVESIVGVLPSGTALREFDIITCANGAVQDGRTTPNTTSNLCAGSTAASKQSPFAEVDYKTSGGHDSYNALQIALQKRAGRGLALNGQYTLGYSQGQHGWIERGCHRRQQCPHAG